MKKLFTLFTVLLLCTASSWADNTPTETIKVSTVMPGSGVPEYQYYVLRTVPVSNTNYYWGNTTQAVSDAASKAKFAFYQVPNITDAYYIYNVTAGQWLSYTTSTSYSNRTNFVENSSSLDATTYWEIKKATSKTGGTECYSIHPYKSNYVVANLFLNWYKGVSQAHTSVGLWQEAPAVDDGSAWSIVSVPATDLDMKLSQEIVSAETSYKTFSRYTKSSDNLITKASQLVNTWGDSDEGTAIGNLIDGNSNTFWHTSWHANASGSYRQKNETNGTNYLEVKDVPEVDLVLFTFTRRAVNNDHVTAWAVYGVPDNKDVSDTSREGLTLLGLFSTPYVSNTETKTSPAFETKGFTRFRFYADQTSSNRGYFHLSEFQMHKVTTENSNPKAEKTATAIATAKSVTTATQADINAIHNAASYYTGPALSDETTKHYFTIKNKRSSKYAAWQNDNERLVQHSTARLEKEKIWYVTDGTGANYKMHNLATSKKLNDTDANTSTSFTDEGSHWYIYTSQINTDYYVISKSDDPTQIQAWDDQGSQTKIGYHKNVSGDAEGTSWTFEELTPTNVKTELNNDYLSWIKTRFIDNEGDAEGQFTGQEFEELKRKYEVAKAVYDNADATAAQVIEQYFILAAITSYPVPTPVTLPATEKVQIRSNYSAVGTSTMTGTGNYIVAADNNVANATWMKWSVAKDAEDDKFYWNIVKQTDNTWKFQNAGTGKYIALASGADNFTMVEGDANGTSFIIEKSADGHYAIVTHNTYKYLHARALEEYLGGQSKYYIGGANQAYWLMPVDSKSQNSCNDWNIMTVDISYKVRLGAELEIINTDYLPNIGDNPAQYSRASASGLQELVDQAQAVYDATEGIPDYAGALSSLQEAVAGLVVNGFSNLYVYTLKNKSDESWVLYYDGSHHYANAKNYNAGSDANNSNRWAIVTRGDRKYVYNLYAGEFLHGKTGISNSYSWPLENSVVNAMEITLQEGNYAGTYKLRDVTCTGTQDYLHCNDAYTYYTTNWGEGTASSWIIEKVADVTLTAEEQKAILDKIVTGPLAFAQGILANAGKVGYPLADSNVARELDAAITAVTSQSEDYTAVTDEQLAAVNTKVTAFQSENTVVLPESGKFYRLKGSVSNKYAYSKGAGQMGMSSTESDYQTAGLFYFNGNNTDGFSILNYKDGYYVYDTYSIGVLGNSTKFQFAAPTTPHLGTLTIKQMENIDNHGRWMYDNGNDATTPKVDRNGDYAANNCDWYIEEASGIPVTFNSSALGYATFNSPVALAVPEGVEAYVCKIDGNKIKLFKANQLTTNAGLWILPANTPVLLYNKSYETDATKYFTVTSTDEKYDNNDFYGTSASEAPDATKYLYYALRKKSGSMGFYQRANQEATLTGFRAWIRIKQAEGARNFVISFDGDSDPTGIAEALGLQDEKVEIYDLNGRKLTGYQKGINIVNGKKVFK